MIPRALQTVAAWIWDASWHAAIVVLIVLLIRQLAGRRLPLTIRSALWSLVAIRLLLVIAPQASWSVFGFLERVTAKAKPVDSPAPENSTGPKVTVGYRDGPIPLESDPLTQQQPTPVSKTQRLAQIAIAIWLAGALLLLTRTILSARKLRICVAQSAPIVNPSLQAQLHKCRREMKVTRPVSLRATASVAGPALAGIIHPTILLPPNLCDRLSPSQLRFVFLHELAHVRRHDLLIEWALAILTALHWFNPVLWLAARLYRADRELSRDEMVLRATGPTQRTSYGHTLLNLLELLSTQRPNPLALAMASQKQNLKQRISMIAELRPTPARLTIAAVLIVFALIAWIVLTNPRQDSRIAANSQPTTKGLSGTAKDAPNNPESQAVQAQLDRRLPEINFDRQGLNDVIDFLRDVSGANIEVNWTALKAAGVPIDAPVFARLKNVSLAKALNTILADAAGGKVKLAFVIDGPTIKISTADDLSTLDTRVYNIRDLLISVPDASSDQKPTSTEPTQTLSQRTQAMVKLIKETIDPTSWNPPYRGAIQEDKGQLIVLQTAENHQGIKQLLTQLRETRSLQILTAAQFVVFDPSILPQDDPAWAPFRASSKTQASDPSTKPKLTATPCLAPAQIAALLEIIAKQPGASTRAAPRLTTFNGQQAYVKVAAQRAFIADYKVMRDEQGKIKSYEPVMDNAESGLTLDLQATVSADRKYVTLTIKPKLSKLLKMHTVPFFGIPTDHPAKLDKPTLQVPEMLISEARMTVSVPDGQTLIIAMGQDAGLLAPEDVPFIPKPGNQMYILVTPRLIQTPNPR